MQQASLLSARSALGPQAREMRPVPSGDLWWLTAVAVLFTACLLASAVAVPGLGWDETVYLSQVDRHVPGAFFSAPRARGVSLLLAPMAALTTSATVLHCYLAVLSGAALLLTLCVWRRLLPAPVPALGGALFAGLWITLFYGPQAMPNLWPLTPRSPPPAASCGPYGSRPANWPRAPTGGPPRDSPSRWPWPR